MLLCIVKIDACFVVSCVYTNVIKHIRMIVKYKVQRAHQNDKNSDLIFIGVEDKVVTKRELPIAIKEGWSVVRKEYFLITHFLDFWRKLDTKEKISITIMLTTIIALINSLLK
jgi:hypothetical protein